MHRELLNGRWKERILRDDSDKVTYKQTSDPNKIADERVLDQRLAGCSDISLFRDTSAFVAEIHLYELEHEQRMEVEGQIFLNRKPGEERTLQDTIYLKNKEFLGSDALCQASLYAQKLQREIDDILDDE